MCILFSGRESSIDLCGRYLPSFGNCMQMSFRSSSPYGSDSLLHLRTKPVPILNNSPKRSKETAWSDSQLDEDRKTSGKKPGEGGRDYETLSLAVLLIIFRASRHKTSNKKQERDRQLGQMAQELIGTAAVT